MKTLITLFALMVSLSSFANGSEEFVGANDHQTIQGRIDAGYITMLENDLQEISEEVYLTIGDLGEPHDVTEGKIRAGIIQQIESKLAELKKVKESIEGKSGIEDSDLEPFNKKISVIKALLANLTA